VGFGFGTQMLDALIFIAYTSESGENVTISPRIGRHHEEPMYTPAVGVKVLGGTFVDNDTYHINAQCTGCRSWPLALGRRGTIDTESTTQPMIYAIGDDSPFSHTDSQEATIERHIAFGKFAIDLKTATGDAGIPNGTETEAGITRGEGSVNSRLGTIFHGLIMSACFIVFFPIGALLIRLPFRLAFWLHLMWQCCTVLGVAIGLSLGVYVATNKNKHPKLNTPHQGLGLTVILLVFGQASLGFLLHRNYKRTQSPSLHGKIHRFLGLTIILLGITNGALGLNFAENNGRLPAYFGLVVFIAVIYTLSQLIFRRRSIRKNAVNSVAASNFREGPYNVRLYNRDRRENNLSQQSFVKAEHGSPQYVNVMPKNEEQRMS
jgi:Cytochrome domain of cellobiose dehydrogenase/Eukaryotic cytochrome b561